MPNAMDRFQWVELMEKKYRGNNDIYIDTTDYLGPRVLHRTGGGVVESYSQYYQMATGKPTPEQAQWDLVDSWLSSKPKNQSSSGGFRKHRTKRTRSLGASFKAIFKGMLSLIVIGYTIAVAVRLLRMAGVI